MLIKAQKKAIRTVVNASRSCHTNSIFSKLNELKLPEMHSMAVFKLTHRILHGPIPSVFEQTIRFKTPSHRYTRAVKNLDLNMPPKSACGFWRAAPKLWNELPLYIREMSKYSNFIKNVKSHLLGQYLNEQRCQIKNCASCAALAKVL